MAEAALAVTAWESLFRAQVSVMRQLSAEFPPGDISLGDYDVLFTLSREPERRLGMKDLVANMLLTQPSVSRLVDRLAARGLVSKLNDPDDRRAVIVELTESGYDAFRRTAVRHMESITKRVGGALEADELKQLAALCDKLHQGGG